MKKPSKIGVQSGKVTFGTSSGVKTKIQLKHYFDFGHLKAYCAIWSQCANAFISFTVQKIPLKLKKKSDLEASIPTYFKKISFLPPLCHLKDGAKRLLRHPQSLENPLIEVFLNYILLEKVMKY